MGIQLRLLQKVIIGSAGLGALVLFAAYTEDIKYFSKVKGSVLEGVNVTFDLSNPFVVAGLLIGGASYLLVQWECKLLVELVELY